MLQHQEDSYLKLDTPRSSRCTVFGGVEGKARNSSKTKLGSSREVHQLLCSLMQRFEALAELFQVGTGFFTRDLRDFLREIKRRVGIVLRIHGE